MDYEQYDLEDFVADPYFKKWVRKGNAKSNEFWESWLEAHPEKADTIAQAKSILTFLQFQVDEASEEETLEVKAKVMYRIKNEGGGKPGHKSVLWFYISIAATVMIILSGSYIVWQNMVKDPYQYYQTAFAEQQEILLADSTLVKLNANSTLKVPVSWIEGKPREVWLEGEAFFEVVKQPNAADGRFIVHTSQLEVEVLGTTFNVQSRHEETQVVLNTGKVKLQKTNISEGEQIVFLEPGEMATADAKQLIKKQVNPQVYSSWKDNRLFFENESIRKIAQRLKDTYGYEVKVDEEQWLNYKFTGSCPADDISILLVALSESFDLKVIRVNKQIYIQHENP
ncbi:FecR domain-containing protein [Porifericola rhodea]|uniref:FecR family protein n=1 Tax=Porifericola rhodea TaxID=930972 RepID=UPI002665562A|nr:FecR domain-containing protein [Porifericola rhodea]WKN30379.1 FecR domain-containing protein [Porifericola rhodea]